MSALGRKNEAVPAFVFTQPSPEEFFAAMTSTGKPGGVNLGGIQNVASRLDVSVDDCCGQGVVDRRAKFRGAKTQDRRFQICVGD